MFKKKKLILILGPESTATRAFTDGFANHNEMLSSHDTNSHFDILDKVWFHLSDKDLKKAQVNFPNNKENKIIVTRRSIPSGKAPGIKAKFLSFPELCLFKELCDNLGYKIFIIITSRSPIPNLESSTKNRSSVDKSFQKAYVQYIETYNYIFNFTKKYSINFLLVSLETYILDNVNFIKSLHKFFNLEIKDINLDIKEDVNKKYYNFYLSRKKNPLKVF